MPRGFSEGFLKPKKDGKGDPRLKYKVGDFLSRNQTIFQRGIQTGKVNLSYTSAGGRAWGSLVNANVVFASVSTPTCVLFGCNRNGYTVTSGQTQIDTHINHSTPWVALDQLGNCYVITPTTGTTGGIKKFPYFNSGTPSASNNNIAGNHIVCDKVDSLYYRPAPTNNIARMAYDLAVQWTKTDILDSGNLEFYRAVSDGLLVTTANAGSGGKLRKYSKVDGSLMWECNYGANASGEIQVDGNGDIYVGRSAAMTKISKDGVLIWQTTDSYMTWFSGRNFTISDVSGLVLYSTQANSPFINGLDAETGVLASLDASLQADETVLAYAGITDGSMKAIGDMLYYYTGFVICKVMALEIKA